MKQRLCSLVMLAALACAIFVAPFSAAAAPSAQVVDPTVIPISGTIPDIGGAFDGTFDLNRFVVRNGELLALGTLTGTLTDALGNVIGSVSNVSIALPVNLLDSTGSCEILDLVLGPLSLDLLGLQVDLSQIVLDITAQSGAGNLLGNLLCAVAGLLDNGGPLQGLARLLNQILGAL